MDTLWGQGKDAIWANEQFTLIDEQVKLRSDKKKGPHAATCSVVTFKPLPNIGEVLVNASYTALSRAYSCSCNANSFSLGLLIWSAMKFPSALPNAFGRT
jgi:hypothetical protein